MGVEEQLQPGEEVVYRAHVTRISLVPWIAGLVLVAAGAAAAWLYAPEPALLIAAVALALFLAATILVKLVVLRSYEHVLTNRRMIQQTGILHKRSMDAPLDKVNNVEHHQTLWGRILGYGNVEIDTASEQQIRGIRRGDEEHQRRHDHQQSEDLSDFLSFAGKERPGNGDGADLGSARAGRKCRSRCPAQATESR